MPSADDGLLCGNQRTSSIPIEKVLRVLNNSGARLGWFHGFFHGGVGGFKPKFAETTTLALSIIDSSRTLSYQCTPAKTFMCQQLRALASNKIAIGNKRAEVRPAKKDKVLRIVPRRRVTLAYADRARLISRRPGTRRYWAYTASAGRLNAEAQAQKGKRQRADSYLIPRHQPGGQT